MQKLLTSQLHTVNYDMMHLIERMKLQLKKYYFTISLATLMCSLYLMFGPVPELFYYNKTAIANGEFWRLYSAHFIHSDLQHLTFNLCALLILSALIEKKSRTLLCISIVSGIVFIDCFLWFNTIGVINYAGFSGVLNTLLVLALFLEYQSHENKIHSTLSVILYVFSLAKIIIELSTQEAFFSNIHWQALPEVHLVGFATGTFLLIFLLRAFSDKKMSKEKNYSVFQSSP